MICKDLETISLSQVSCVSSTNLTLITGWALVQSFVCFYSLIYPRIKAHVLRASRQSPASVVLRRYAKIAIKVTDGRATSSSRVARVGEIP